MQSDYCGHGLKGISSSRQLDGEVFLPILQRESEVPKVTTWQGQSWAVNPGSLTPMPVLCTCPEPPGQAPSVRTGRGRQEEGETHTPQVVAAAGGPQACTWQTKAGSQGFCLRARPGDSLLEPERQGGGGGTAV